MKLKITIYIHYRKYAWESNGYYFALPSIFEDEDSRVYVGPQEVEIEVPEDFDPRPAQIAALDAQKQKIMADFNKSVADINERISRLQALEYKS
jgi:hypothetical protein